MERLKAHVLVLITLIVVVCAPALGQEQDVPVKIGVLAKRGFEKCPEKWAPTAEYLTTQIPGHSFTIVPLDYEEIDPAAERGEVDFILANPSFYVGLENLHGANRIATLKNRRLDGTFTLYGGVIFHRADRDDIQNLPDLKGKTFMAVKETSFGGWQIAWRELKEQGIDPHSDFADLRFGGTHDAVVYAVCDGKVDAGTVRTDTLERMAIEGKIRLEDFHVLEHDHIGEDVRKFPFLYSTRPYPEWPMAKLAHTSNNLAEKVTAALVGMSADCPAAHAARCAGWTVPLNYQPVHDCLKELRVGPYKDYGKITFGDVLRRYWPWIASAVVLLTGMAVTLASVLRLLRQRKRAEEALRESEERYRGVVEDTPVLICRFLPDGEITYVNEAYCKYFARTSEELVGSSFLLLVSEADRETVKTNISSLTVESPTQSHEHRVVAPGGEIRWQHWTNRVLFDTEGKVVAYQAIGEDITNRKRAEEALRESEERFRAIAENIPGVVCSYDHHPDGRRSLIYVAPGLDELLGEGAGAILGESVDRFFDLIHPEDREGLQRAADDAVDTGRPVDYEYQVMMKTGDTRWVHSITRPIPQGGGVIRWHGVLINITERKRAEEELQKLASIVRHSRELVILADLDGRMFFLNEAGGRMLGIDPENVSNTQIMEVVPEHLHGLMQSELLPALMAGGMWQGDLQYRNIKTNGITDVHAMTFVIKDPSSGKPVYLANVSLDITDRKRAEEALRESEAKYRTFFDNSVDAMLVIEDYLFVDCNKAAMAMLRYDSKDDVIHRVPAELSPEAQPDGRRSQEKAVEMMNTAIDRGNHFFEWDHKRKDGHVFPVEVSLTAIRQKNRTLLHTVWRDISDRKRAEEALLKAQESFLAQERHGRERVEVELAKVREKLVNQTRLATIGQVAASIAHELRNPLGAVRNAAYYLKRHVPTENPKLPEYLSIIDQEVSTANTVIRNMMEMARSKEPMKEPIDLGKLVREVLSRIRPPDTIQCTISLDPDPYVVSADPGQLRQVINNILVNAVQVMAGKGAIRVEARRDADYDTIMAQDSGPGVAAESRERVFEPLYTTKAKGTGLGLTICRQIIDRHGGMIELMDHEGSGALFRIRLPRQSARDPINDV